MLLVGLLLAHSWFRWAVLLSTVGVGARCAWGWARRRDWTARDSRFGRLWVSAVDIQVSLGLTLYFVASPTAAIARADWRAAWANEYLRFFGIVHPLLMFAAASVAHGAWVWNRQCEDRHGGERFRRLGLGVIGSMLLVLIAIPWPSLPYGRTLARLP